jgi:CDGSH-type Zn-finger protein/truncated hemoglobin YjbI
VPRITERLPARCGDLFNVSYEILLQTLERFFAHTEETDAQLQTLADATISLMVGALKPLGDLLTTLPVGSEHPGTTAGPSFELFYEDDYLIPHRGAAWALLEERVREAASFCALIEEIATEPVLPVLEGVRGALTGVADSLVAHFGEWGATSRFGRSSDAAPDGAAGLAGPLQAQALALAAAARERVAHPRRDAQLLTLFDGALSASAAAAEATTAGAANTRRAAADAAERLVHSVLRPLGEAIVGGRVPADGAHDKAQQQPPNARGGELDALVWQLAQQSTKLAVATTKPGAASAKLAEATAALQDLALTLAPQQGDDGAQSRLAALRELQSGTPAGIRCEHDGPYLATNAERMSTWLGEQLEVRPQMALCRCGESARKPLCDGACARVGFSDAKDPKRVPDRRDTYEGVQLTVFDNRGICQHSGFCTDRLNTVFHTEGAFVTPSGGRMDDIIGVVRDCPSGALSYAIDGVEARAQVDWDATREPAIEVSKDGPYRITGAIPLTDEDGAPVTRAAGSSLEHYALCRCGHSQNKPFCSGMHWYVGFADPPAERDGEPTLFEWCGGLPALTRMTRIFYEKHVPSDPLLAPLFADMAPDHPQRVARWLGEVFGGPKLYSESYGGYERMVSRHLGKALTDQQRARWVELLAASAQEAGLPNDPEFQAAFRSYLEWGSRVALENSQPGAKPPLHMPMPRWWWACDATPGARAPALADDQDADDPPTLPAEDEPVGFEEHIKGLFSERDRTSMKFAFDLWSYDDVAQHADAIAQRLTDGSMPCDGAWPAERIAVFRRWVDAGTPARAQSS